MKTVVTNKRPLMKYFAAVLRKRALSTVPMKEPIHPQIVNLFTRKELIAIIKDKYDGNIPKEYALLELENSQLLSLIGDDIFLISYMTKQWSEEKVSLTKLDAKQTEEKLKKTIPKNKKNAPISK